MNNDLWNICNVEFIVILILIYIYIEIKKEIITLYMFDIYILYNINIY